jgi:hypothetical protein
LIQAESTFTSLTTEDDVHLDIDVTRSYGPETITVTLNASAPSEATDPPHVGTYHFYVHHYYGKTRLVHSNAKMELYSYPHGKIHEILLRKSVNFDEAKQADARRGGRTSNTFSFGYWKVFSFNLETNEFIIANELHHNAAHVNAPEFMRSLNT